MRHTKPRERIVDSLRNFAIFAVKGCFFLLLFTIATMSAWVFAYIMYGIYAITPTGAGTHPYDIEAATTISSRVVASFTQEQLMFLYLTLIMGVFAGVASLWTYRKILTFLDHGRPQRWYIDSFLDNQ